MITPVTTIRKSGAAHQNPRLLCQFQSRARTHGPPRSSVIFFRFLQLHSFGHHRNGPVVTRMRKPRLHAPVMARPEARLSDPLPSQRCSPSTSKKNARSFGGSSPRSIPVYGSTNIVRSRPKSNATGAAGSNPTRYPRRHSPLGSLHPCQQLIDRKPLRSGSRLRLKTAICPVDDLALVSEQDAGHRHDEDHQPRHAAGGQMYPEKKSARSHREATGLILPPSAAAGCGRRL